MEISHVADSASSSSPLSRSADEEVSRHWPLDRTFDLVGAGSVGLRRLIRGAYFITYTEELDGMRNGSCHCQDFSLTKLGVSIDLFEN